MHTDRPLLRVVADIIVAGFFDRGALQEELGDAWNIHHLRQRDSGRNRRDREDLRSWE